MIILTIAWDIGISNATFSFTIRDGLGSPKANIMEWSTGKLSMVARVSEKMSKPSYQYQETWLDQHNSSWYLYRLPD